MVKKTTKRKFSKVRKTKSGVPLKYLAGLTGEKENSEREKYLKLKGSINQEAYLDPQ